jgi:hypothetical protein
VWADENPRAIKPDHQQWFFNNTWAGICGDNLFGPHVLPHRVTEWNYKACLENITPDFSADVPLIIPRELHIMDVGAPEHFSLVARRYLNRKFPCQWIDRGGQITLSPRSPDVCPLDLYVLVGPFNPLVYSTPVVYVQTLRNRIVADFQTISNMPGI